MMRSLGERGSIWFCCEQIQAAINLKRVRADNLGTDFARDIGSQLRLPGRSWADDKERVPHLFRPTRPADSFWREGGDDFLEARVAAQWVPKRQQLQLAIAGRGRILQSDC